MLRLRSVSDKSKSCAVTINKIHMDAAGFALGDNVIIESTKGKIVIKRAPVDERRKI